jgi:uncharacterized protein YfaS (alpha-2-macroglobulin family)
VIDDRKLYRPGEEVNIKGWIRKIDLTPTGGTEMFNSAGGTVNYLLKDAQHNQITKGTAKLNALAGFNFKFTLPAKMNLGSATLEFELKEDGGKYTHSFQVQEFRRPEFEITARTSEAPHFVGSFATATMTAAYYSGGGLANTEVDWEVSSKPTIARFQIATASGTRVDAALISLPVYTPATTEAFATYGVIDNGSTWYEHQNLRDERAEAFTSLLWEGVHEYTYFARATTPGLFIVPPTKAEEMYAPESFGRSRSDRVRVK